MLRQVLVRTHRFTLSAGGTRQRHRQRQRPHWLVARAVASSSSSSSAPHGAGILQHAREEHLDRISAPVEAVEQLASLLRSGDDAAAHELWDHLLSSGAADARHCNAMLRACADKAEVAEGLVAVAEAEGLELDRESYVLLRGIFERAGDDARATEAARQAKALFRPHGRLDQSPQFRGRGILAKTRRSKERTAELDELLHSGMMHQARRKFDQMLAHGSADDFQLNVMVRACRDVEEAWALVDSCRANGIQPNVVTYNTLLFKLDASGRGGEIGMMIERMRADGVQPDGYTHEILERHASREATRPSREETEHLKRMILDGQRRQAWAHFEALLASGAADVHQLNTMIRFACTDSEKATALMDRCLGLGIDPDVTTFNAIIRKARAEGASVAADGIKGGRGEGQAAAAVVDNPVVAALLDRMAELYIQPDRRTQAALDLEYRPGEDELVSKARMSELTALLNAGRDDEAIRLFDTWLAKGEADAFVVAKMAAQPFVQCNGSDGVRNLVDRATAAGVELDNIVYNTLVTQLMREGRGEEARGVMDEMRAAGCQPDAYTHDTVEQAEAQAETNVLFALLEEKDLEAAQDCFDDMLAAGTARVIDLNAMLKAALDSDAAEAMVQQAHDAGVRPTVDTYNVRLHKLLLEARRSEAEALAKSMAAEGIKRSRRTTTTLRGEYAPGRTLLLVRLCEAGRFGQAVEVYERACAADAGCGNTMHVNTLLRWCPDADTAESLIATLTGDETTPEGEGERRGGRRRAGRRRGGRAGRSAPDRETWRRLEEIREAGAEVDRDGRLAVGMRVRATSGSRKGTEGVLSFFKGEKERWRVAWDDGANRYMKAAHLEPAEVALEPNAPRRRTTRRTGARRADVVPRVRAAALAKARAGDQAQQASAASVRALASSLVGDVTVSGDAEHDDLAEDEEEEDLSNVSMRTEEQELELEAAVEGVMEEDEDEELSVVAVVADMDADVDSNATHSASEVSVLNNGNGSGSDKTFSAAADIAVSDITVTLSNESVEQSHVAHRPEPEEWRVRRGKEMDMAEHHRSIATLVATGNMQDAKKAVGFMLMSGLLPTVETARILRGRGGDKAHASLIAVDDEEATVVVDPPRLQDAADVGVPVVSVEKNGGGSRNGSRSARRRRRRSGRSGKGASVGAVASVAPAAAAEPVAIAQLLERSSQ